MAENDVKDETKEPGRNDDGGEISQVLSNLLLQKPRSVGEVNAESVIFAENVHIHTEEADKSEQPDKEDEESLHLPGMIQMFHKELISKTGASVFRGQQTSEVFGCRDLAIKSLPYNEKNMEEAKTLKKLTSHSNVVTIIHSDAYMQGPFKYMYIAMELCHEQNLHDHVTENNNNNVPFDPQLSISQAKQLVEGLHFIHENDIIHRDLKPHNVLFSIDKKILKIADFGISKAMTSGRSFTSVTNARVGTDGYRAPETYNSNEISQRADIFSLGLVFYFLWSNGHHAFGDDADDWNSNIKRNRNRDLSQLLTSNVKSAEMLLHLMLKFIPKQRPLTQQILDDQFFKEECKELDPIVLSKGTDDVIEEGDDVAEKLDNLDIKHEDILDENQDNVQAETYSLDMSSLPDPTKFQTQLWQEIHQLQVVAEENLISGIRCDKDIGDIVYTMLALGIPTNDVLQNVKLHIASEKFSGAFILHLCAYKLIKSPGKEKNPDCHQDLMWIKDMRYILQSLIEQKGARNMTSQQIISMYRILFNIKHVSDDLNVLNKAAVLRDMGKNLCEATHYAEAVDLLIEGVEVMKHHFRSKATKYKLFGRLYDILGLAYYNLNRYRWSITACEVSIESEQNADDYLTPEERERDIAGTAKNMLISKIKLCEAKANQHIRKDEHYSAFEELQKILPLLGDQEKRFDLLIQMIECEMRFHKIRKETVVLLANEYKVLDQSADDILHIAETKEEEKQIMTAITLYRCAAELYRFAGVPNVAVTGITRCLEALQKICTATHAKPEFTVMLKIIRITQSLLDDLRRIKNADSEVKAKCEAKCLLLICLQWDYKSSTVLEMLTEGVKVLKDEFGAKATNYKTYGDLLHAIALTKSDLGDLPGAIEAYDEAIFATGKAKDYEKEEEKQRMLRTRTSGYRDLRHKQLDNMNNQL